jgi:WW domain-binding protein 2
VEKLIFQASKGSGNTKPSFDTLSVLLHGILSTQFIQPTFSANYLLMELKPANGGGLSEGTKCEVRLKDQPLLPFVATLEKSRERAVYRRRDAMFDDDLREHYRKRAEVHC